MNKKVFDYFVDLDSARLPRESGVISFDGDDIRQTSEVKDDRISKFYINPVGKYYYGKTCLRPEHIAGHIVSKMYNDLGILTPPQYIMQKYYHDFRTPSLSGEKAIFLAQSVKGVVPFVVKDASSIFYEWRDIAKKRLQQESQGKFKPGQIPFAGLVDKWEILHNEALREFFLEFLTPECLEELIGISLIDEVRGDVDRHGLNYFFYKSLHEDKFEGIIPIDLDNMNVAFHSHLCNSNENFLTFITERPTKSYTIQQTSDPRLTHRQRIQNIIKEIEASNFSKENITLLKRALSYDLPSLTRKTIDSTSLLEELGNQVYNPLAYLWDYNRETLGKELGL